MNLSKYKNAIAIGKLVLLIGILIGLPVALFLIFPEFVKNLDNLDAVNDLLAQYESASFFIYIGLQAVQIVISVIPGQMLQFAAGYIYGLGAGTVVALIGIVVGTTITFYLAKLLGKDSLYVFFKEEKINKFVNALNHKRAYLIIFILYLIPGFPKDLIAYAAGVSNIKFFYYLILSLLGRLPSLVVTIAIGKMFRTGRFTEIIILAVIIGIFFIIAFIFRKKLKGVLDKIMA